MSRFSRNYMLLYNDIKNVFVNIWRDKNYEIETFPMKNRKEVLYLYRHFLKNIPPMYTSLLEKRCAFEVNSF